MKPWLKRLYAVQRWLFGKDEEPAAAPPAAVAAPETARARSRPDHEHITSFVNEMRGRSQDWLARTRLVTFQSVQERLGDKWPRLQQRVELLADKVIRDELSSRDSYLNMGGAEFLIYIAEGGPEEVRLRCLGILESIHEKLFGVDDQLGDGPKRYAECHFAHIENLELEWEAAELPDGAEPTTQTTRAALRRLFRREAEFMDAGEIAASIQATIDAVIFSASDLTSAGDAEPIVERLKNLSRSQQRLELALSKRAAVPDNSAAVLADSMLGHADGLEQERNTKLAQQMSIAKQDLAELISSLSFGPNSSLSELLAVLAKLLRARAKRAAKTPEDEKALDSEAKPDEEDELECERTALKCEYLPVFRSVAQGDDIFQGINRLHPLQRPGPVYDGADRAAVEWQHRRDAALEQTLLEYALQFLESQGSSTRFLLMVPVNVETLRRGSWLRRYSMTLRQAQIQTKKQLIIEVTGYRDSDNTIAIRRAIDLLRMQSRAVFVTTPSLSISQLRSIAAECKGLGIHAVGIDLTQCKGAEPEMVSALQRLSAVKFQFSIATYVSGITSLNVLSKAIASGTSYFCAPALHPPQAIPGEIKRTNLAELRMTA